MGGVACGVGQERRKARGGGEERGSDEEKEVESEFRVPMLFPQRVRQALVKRWRVGESWGAEKGKSSEG